MTRIGWILAAAHVKQNNTVMTFFLLVARNNSHSFSCIKKQQKTPMVFMQPCNVIGEDEIFMGAFWSKMAIRIRLFKCTEATRFKRDIPVIAEGTMGGPHCFASRHRRALTLFWWIIGGGVGGIHSLSWTPCHKVSMATIRADMDLTSINMSARVIHCRHHHLRIS